MITSLKNYLTETTPAAATLVAATKPKENTSKAARAMALFQKLGSEDQDAHLRWLEQSLAGHHRGR